MFTARARRQLSPSDDSVDMSRRRQPVTQHGRVQTDGIRPLAIRVGREGRIVGPLPRAASKVGWLCRKRATSNRQLALGRRRSFRAAPESWAGPLSLTGDGTRPRPDTVRQRAFYRSGATPVRSAAVIASYRTIAASRQREYLCASPIWRPVGRGRMNDVVADGSRTTVF